MDHVPLSDAVFAHHVQPINSHLGMLDADAITHRESYYLPDQLIERIARHTAPELTSKPSVCN